MRKFLPDTRTFILSRLFLLLPAEYILISHIADFMFGKFYAGCELAAHELYLAVKPYSFREFAQVFKSLVRTAYNCHLIAVLYI